MSTDKQDTNATITIAVITTLGVIGGALFANWEKVFPRPNPMIPPVLTPSSSPIPPVLTPSSSPSVLPNPEQPTSALGWYEQANRLYKNDNYVEAIRAYDQVIGSNDDSRDVCLACTWAKRGHCLELLGDYEHAALSYRQALRYEPDISWVQENLAALQEEGY